MLDLTVCVIRDLRFTEYLPTGDTTEEEEEVISTRRSKLKIKIRDEIFFIARP